MISIPAEQVKKMLSYDPKTGIFTWLIKPNRRVRIGDIAGFRRPDGYLIIKLNKVAYRAHRLAWVYMTGAEPMYDIDHIDGNPTNDSFSNLRDVTTAQNIQNQRKAHARNKNGFLGVSWHAAGKCWRARICVSGKQILLGYFKTPDEAHQAYVQAKRKHHHTCTI